MNVWMKRGLRTALLTGGLLAAGSGIASADDSIDVTVPVTVTDNALAVLGTSPGSTAPEVTLPAVAGVVHADLGAATVSAPVAVGGNSADVAGLDVVQPAAAPAPDGGSGSAVDADVPVTVTGNAVAVLGEAAASGSAGPAPSSGGDASVADVDVPVTVCGNSAGILGDATATCTTPAAGSTTDTTGAGITGAGSLPGTGTTEDGGTTGSGDEPAVARQDHAVDALDGTTTSGSTVGLTVGTTASSTTAGNTTAGNAMAGNAMANGTRSATADRSGVLASTGSNLALSALGGLVALLVGLALSIWFCRREGPLT